MSNRTLTTLDFYRVLQRIVAGWPATYDGNKEIVCQRLNTFAVLHSIDELNDPSLGKDPTYVNKDLFFSRAWDRSGYNASAFRAELPALYVWENVIQDANVGDGQLEITFSMGFGLDYQNECRNLAYAEQKQILYGFYNALMFELRDVVKANFIIAGAQGPAYGLGFGVGFDSVDSIGGATNAGSYSDRWVSERYLNRMIDAGLIEEWTYEEQLTTYMPTTQVGNGLMLKDKYDMAPLLLIMPLTIQFPECYESLEIEYVPGLLDLVADKVEST